MASSQQVAGLIQGSTRRGREGSGTKPGTTYDFTHVDGGLDVDLGYVLERMELGWESKKKCGGCVDFGSCGRQR